jgi:plastocyanin
MHPITNLFALLTLISAAAATSHDILVGNGGNTTYSPNSLTAAKGDTVVFHFYPGNHDVVQSAFDSPCATSSGFYSGFIDSESGAAKTTFTITINDTTPIWIYCSQVDHCQLGMVMVINPP